MNHNTASAIVGALQSVTEALTVVAAHALQAPEPLPASLPIEAANGPRFVDKGDGTVIDAVNRLQWSKATLTPKCIRQDDALKLCEGLSLAGYGDWRLPTRAELLTLVDETRHEPAIDVDAFPDTKRDWYWTSTVCAWSSAHAWFVDFDYGGCGDGDRVSSGGLVRAVRSLTPAETAALAADKENGNG